MIALEASGLLAVVLAMGALARPPQTNTPQRRAAQLGLALGLVAITLAHDLLAGLTLAACAAMLAAPLGVLARPTREVVRGAPSDARVAPAPAFPLGIATWALVLGAAPLLGLALGRAALALSWLPLALRMVLAEHGVVPSAVVLATVLPWLGARRALATVGVLALGALVLIAAWPIEAAPIAASVGP